MVLFSLLAYSVRERPDTEVAPDVPPQAVQALGLHDQEEDDEGAEQHEAEVRNQVQDGLRLEEDSAERLHGVTGHDGQQRDEDGPEDRAQHGAETAHDDHGQGDDGDTAMEMPVVGDAEGGRV